MSETEQRPIKDCLGQELQVGDMVVMATGKGSSPEVHFYVIRSWEWAKTHFTEKPVVRVYSLTQAYKDVDGVWVRHFYNDVYEAKIGRVERSLKLSTEMVLNHPTLRNFHAKAMKLLEKAQGGDSDQHLSSQAR